MNRILTNLALLLPLFLFFCLYCSALRSLDTSVLIPSVSCALSALSQSFALLNSLFNAFSSFKTTFPLLHCVISLNGKASPTNQSAHQADGSSPLTVVGETISCFQVTFIYFLEGLMIENLDVDVLVNGDKLRFCPLIQKSSSDRK